MHMWLNNSRAFSQIEIRVSIMFNLNNLRCKYCRLIFNRARPLHVPLFSGAYIACQISRATLLPCYRERIIFPFSCQIFTLGIYLNFLQLGNVCAGARNIPLYLLARNSAFEKLD